MPAAARRNARSARRAIATASHAIRIGGGVALSVLVLGCRVDDVGSQEAACRILDLSSGTRGEQVVTLGTEMVVYAQKNARFRHVINASALCVADTVGVVWAARTRGARLSERVTGIDLIDRICEACAREGGALYLLGGSEGIAERAAARLVDAYRGLRIAGTHGGYFDEGDSARIAGTIRASGARLLLCGLGSPRQEYWLHDHLGETGCGAGIGVGGAFDVISGRLPRAPALWRRLHFEWLYRLVREPRRWRRQLALPAFVGLVALDALGLRRLTA